MTYHVALLNFEGPLDLLLQLIERSELSITEISLARVTEQYLGYINQIDQLHPAELNRFIELASKLIYIKSLALLPNSDAPKEETDLAELTEQLAEYQHYQTAAAYLKELLAGGQRSWSRPAETAIGLGTEPAALTLPPNLELELLRQTFATTLAKLPPASTSATLKRKVSLAEMTERICRLLRSSPEVGLSQLMTKAADRLEALVLFLALLELVKSGQLRVVQEHQFHDIRLLSVV